MNGLRRAETAAAGGNLFHHHDDLLAGHAGTAVLFGNLDAKPPVICEGVDELVWIFATFVVGSPVVLVEIAAYLPDIVTY